jgi:hypothetical protein
MLRFLFRINVFLLLLVAFLELLFRTFIPASMEPDSYQEPESLILRFNPDTYPDGVFTLGRLANYRFPWHINREGWVSSKEYIPGHARSRPLAAVIGDSYVEGFYVHEEDHFANVAEDQLENACDFYRFGTGGTRVSQYIEIARYVRDTFAADVYIFMLAKNDLIGCMRSHLSPLSRQFRETEDGFEIVPPSRHTPSRFRFLKKSSLVRYLIYNASINIGLGQVDNELNDPTKANHNSPEEERLLEQRIAVYLIQEMQRELPDARLVFLVDGDRHALYDGADQATLKEARVLDSLEEQYGIRCLDLGPVFSRDWKQYGNAFNYDFNYHWNDYGNQIVGQALAEYIKELLPVSNQLD